MQTAHYRVVRSQAVDGDVMPSMFQEWFDYPAATFPSEWDAMAYAEDCAADLKRDGVTHTRVTVSAPGNDCILQFCL